MKMVKPFVFCVAAFLPLNAALAKAEYAVSIQEYFFSPDEVRDTQDRGFGTDLTISVPFQENTAFEWRLFGTWIDDKGTLSRDAYRYGLGLDLRHDLGDPDQISPYLVGGIGVVRNEVLGKGDDSGLTANLGVGWMSKEVSASGVRLRGDLRGVYDDFLDGTFDWRAGLGVYIPLRKPTERLVEVEKVVYKEAPVAEPLQAPADADDDGVADQQDACPNTLGGTTVDRTGCAFGLRDIKGVTFMTNSAHLTPNAKQVLDHVSRALFGQPDIQVQILGHTDYVGSEQANKKLSQDRALAVRDYLIQRGIAAERMRLGAFGEARPAADNSSPSGREMNRRVELRISL